MQGKVKWFNEKKGYGFIGGEDEKDYFVHFSQIEPGKKDYKTLDEGQEVVFEPANGPKGLQAQNVEKA